MCLHYCTTLILRPKGIQLTVDRPSALSTGEEADNSAPSTKVVATLNKYKYFFIIIFSNLTFPVIFCYMFNFYICIIDYWK